MTYLNHPRILFFGSICSNLALPQKVTLRTKAPPIIAYRQIRKSMNMCDLSQVNHDITVKMCDLSKFNNEIIEKQRQTGWSIKIQPWNHRKHRKTTMIDPDLHPNWPFEWGKYGHMMIDHQFFGHLIFRKKNTTNHFLWVNQGIAWASSSARRSGICVKLSKSLAVSKEFWGILDLDLYGIMQWMLISMASSWKDSYYIYKYIYIYIVNR